jgi:lipopolysaccharide transport system ATP-binding protein
MSTIAVQADGISKQYHIGAIETAKLNLQERAFRAVSAPFRRIGRLVTGKAASASDLSESFWALDDVSFRIDQGERVAVIGRNGAGKSTLLKILARVTQPTRGTALIRGRMGSLLEVGTGFHPELTGRENVFLNASIIGMRKSEVERKFDSIVAFSEIEKFIDTPVKHYSSGMRVRLAFSVAAHLEPEVLIVDEVLSVGDVVFRKKCMEKMHEVAANGATILVVSHNAQTVTSICDRAIWLDQGRMLADGPAGDIVADYQRRGLGLTSERRWDHADPTEADIARLLAVRILDERGDLADSFDVRQRFCIESEVEVLKPGYGIMLKNEVFTGSGMQAFSSLDTQNPMWSKRMWPPGVYKLRMWIPGNFLQVDSYSINVNLWAWEPQQQHLFNERNVVSFNILERMDGSSARAGFTGPVLGVVRPVLDWDMVPDIRVAGARPADALPLVRN